jgi:hypothetical protein
VLYSYKGEYPKVLPERIVLSNGTFRTDSSTYTEEEIADAGYVWMGELPDNVGILLNNEEYVAVVGNVNHRKNFFKEDAEVDLLSIFQKGILYDWNYNQKAVWDSSKFVVEDLTSEEIQMNTELYAHDARVKRDEYLNDEVWRIDRYLSEVRQGITPTDDIVLVDKYLQGLRDLPTQEGFPFHDNIVWPEREFLTEDES